MTKHWLTFRKLEPGLISIWRNSLLRWAARWVCNWLLYSPSLANHTSGPRLKELFSSQTSIHFFLCLFREFGSTSTLMPSSSDFLYVHYWLVQGSRFIYFTLFSIYIKLTMKQLLFAWQFSILYKLAEFWIGGTKSRAVPRALQEITVSSWLFKGIIVTQAS